MSTAFSFLNKAIDKAHEFLRRLIFSIVKYDYYLKICNTAFAEPYKKIVLFNFDLNWINIVTMELLTLGLALFIVALIFIPTLRTGASPVPTSRRMQKALLSLLPEHLPCDPQGVIYELGSGWGGLAFAVAKKYPKTTVVGYEISLLPWLYALLRKSFQPQKNLHFTLSNFLNRDLSNGVLVLCYLLPKPMDQLRIKLEDELALGALVASNTFAFRGWRPVDEKTADDMYASHVFLYEAGNTN